MPSRSFWATCAEPRLWPLKAPPRSRPLGYVRTAYRPGSWRRPEAPPLACRDHAPIRATPPRLLRRVSAARPPSPGPGFRGRQCRGPAPGARKAPPPRRHAASAPPGFRSGTEGRAACKVKAAECRRGRVRLAEEVLRALPPVLIPVPARPQVLGTRRVQWRPHSRGAEIKEWWAGGAPGTRAAGLLMRERRREDQSARHADWPFPVAARDALPLCRTRGSL